MHTVRADNLLKLRFQVLQAEKFKYLKSRCSGQFTESTGTNGTRSQASALFTTDSHQSCEILKDIFAVNQNKVQGLSLSSKLFRSRLTLLEQSNLINRCLCTQLKVCIRWTMNSANFSGE